MQVVKDVVHGKEVEVSKWQGSQKKSLVKLNSGTEKFSGVKGGGVQKRLF